MYDLGEILDMKRVTIEDRVTVEARSRYIVLSGIFALPAPTIRIEHEHDCSSAYSPTACESPIGCPQLRHEILLVLKLSQDRYHCLDIENANAMTERYKIDWPAAKKTWIPRTTPPLTHHH